MRRKHPGSVAAISVIIVLVIYFIFGPTINFFIGVAMGGFIKLFIGGLIAKGLAMIGIENFNVNAIPYICGIIACLSSFLPQKNPSIKAKENRYD